jgi:ankyrin repeat protein
MEAGLISVMTGLHSEKTAALLRKAVKRGKEKKVLRLLEKEPTLLNSDLPHHAVLLNPHIKSEGQPLAVAAKHGQLGVARLLLERGAHIDTVGYWGTALHWAAREGHEEMVALLLSKGAQASSRDAIGSTPFMEACMYGQLGVMQMLLEHTGAQTLEEQDRLERTALQCAACSGNEEAVAFLLSKGMQANSRDKTGTTPLMEACQEKKALGVVRLLLQHRGGRGLDETDECGRAALHLAVSEGIEKMVAFLLSQGADATIRDGEGFTSFLTACHWGNVGVAQMLLRHMGGQGLEERDAYERTGLHLACGEYSNSTMVRFLLLAGADPSVRDDQGETPRAVAEEWSYESVDVLNVSICTCWILAGFCSLICRRLCAASTTRSR